ncbi:hypothetical protein WA026_007972 [Henosepilachna vigintioctopunctata]|uniref:Uncharacterized protein n=1 Tax=Henosepilachna vigintioctopunctata TaxID=420089 RepID=A0AAW1TP17_9CUCU
MFFRQLLLCSILLLLVSFCTPHGHSHDDHYHDEEPAHFKYSKAANEEFQKSQESIHHTHSKRTGPVLNVTNLWLYALGSTVLISAAPFFILFLVPLDNTDKQKPLLKILLAFAAGGLLGDAFLHLIPSATGDHDHSHSHGHSHSVHKEDKEHGHDMSVGLWVLSGIITFLVIEKVMRILKGSHSHGHSHKPNIKVKSSDKDKKAQEKKKEDTAKDIKVAGYLNLAADFSHNFTDGLAIGSSYLAGNTIGVVTTITILLHEVPHEIGDFAILLQSGVSRKNAMLLQLTTAIGALLGTTISLFAQNSDGAIATSWILPFTAGGFIYIALVSVIPELLDEEKPEFVQTILQVSALLCGIGLMVVISILE